jgi:hypothetical protein
MSALGAPPLAQTDTPPMKLDWPAILGNACGLIIYCTWLYLMVLLASHAAWSHQAAHQALEAFR